MSGVLVDSSVWVDHYRHGNDTLIPLLDRDLVLIHPLIIGELACGTLNRPGFSRRSRASESIAFQTLPARARCWNHADA
ncbi:MAG: hypothetical protein KKE66_05080, partial [Gammaproteobacteria bacterium]|nr:hypothetical protein [Gammaproteobacteria bacterium]